MFKSSLTQKNSRLLFAVVFLPVLLINIKFSMADDTINYGLGIDINLKQHSRKSFQNPSVSGSYGEYCRSGKQVEQLKETFNESIQEVPDGTPKDTAITIRKSSIRKIKKNALRYFLSDPKGSLLVIRSNYTMFIPPKLQSDLGISCGGGPCGFRQDKPLPSKGLSDRESLWNQYISKFTSIKEAPEESGNALNFEASLDLSVFCKYGRANDDLVTHSAVPISGNPDSAEGEKVEAIQEQVTMAPEMSTEEVMRLRETELKADRLQKEWNEETLEVPWRLGIDFTISGPSVSNSNAGYELGTLGLSLEKVLTNYFGLRVFGGYLGGGGSSNQSQSFGGLAGSLAIPMYIFGYNKKNDSHPMTSNVYLVPELGLASYSDPSGSKQRITQVKKGLSVGWDFPTDNGNSGVLGIGLFFGKAFYNDSGTRMGQSPFFGGVRVYFDYYPSKDH